MPSDGAPRVGWGRGLLRGFVRGASDGSIEAPDNLRWAPMRVRVSLKLGLLLSSALFPGCAAPVACPPPSEAALTLRQLALPGPSIGVSTLVTLPDGARLLVDVGNDAHDALIREATGGAVDFLVVTHGDEDHAGGLDQLVDVVGDARPVDTLGVHDLGSGVTLTVFLAQGVLALPEGPLDLRGEVPELDRSENARSVAGALRFLDFVWVFAGDLTGGGKDTPDIESAVAARGDALLDPGSASLLSLSHHGITSSNQGPWLDWLLPDDGVRRDALVGSSGAYLSAPAGDVLDAVGPRLQGGAVWTGEPGALTPKDHPHLRFTDADVWVSVDAAGAVTICGEPRDPGGSLD